MAIVRCGKTVFHSDPDLDSSDEPIQRIQEPCHQLLMPGRPEGKLALIDTRPEEGRFLFLTDAAWLERSSATRFESYSCNQFEGHPSSSVSLRKSVIEVRPSADDRVVLVTDGITEAEDADGTQFGVAQFQSLTSAPDPVASVFSAVEQSCQGVSLQDDQTILVVHQIA